MQSNKRLAALVAVLLCGAPNLGAQQPMTLAPTWVGTIDGRTEARLWIQDRELAGNRIFLALARGADQGFTVRRIDARTGDVAWTTTHVSDDLAGGPGREGVVDLAVTADGSEAFTIALPGIRITRFRGSDGVPCVVDIFPGANGEELVLTPREDRLVALGEGIVAAYDRASGTRLWTTSLPIGDVGELVADYRRAYVIAGDEVLALRLGDGSIAWSADVSGLAATTLEKGPGDEPLVVSGGGILFAGGGGSRGLDPATGAVVWSDGLPGQKITALSPDRNVVYRLNSGVALTSQPPELNALDVRTGAVLWSSPLPQQFGIGVTELSVSGDGTLLALPALWGNIQVHETAGGTLVADIPFAPIGKQTQFGALFGPGHDTLISHGGTNGGVPPVPNVVLAQDLNGNERWSRLVRGEGSAEDVLADAVLSPDAQRYFLGGDSASKLLLGAFEAGSGETLWTLDENDASGAEHLVASDHMLFAATESELLAHDGREGKRVWRRTTEGVNDLLVSKDGRALYVARTVPGAVDSGIGVQKIDAATGVERWSMIFDGAGGDDRPGALALSPDGQTLYVAAEKRQPTPTVATLALHEESGAVRWEALSPEPRNWSALEVVPSQDGDRVFVLGGTRFFAYEAATGAEVWKTPAVGQPAATQGPPPVTCGLSPDGSRLVGAGFGFKVVANKFLPIWRAFTVDTNTGLVDWDREISVNQSSEVMDVIVTGTTPTVIVSGQRSSTLFVGLDLETGDELFNASAVSSSQPGSIRVASSSDRVLVGHTQGGITADLRAAVYDLPSLVSSLSPVSLATGGDREFRVRFGAANVDATYAILGSASASGGGIPLREGVVLPLEPDAYFALTLGPSRDGFRGFRGRLNAAGEAHAMLVVPPDSDPSFAGVELTHVAITMAPDGTIDLSNPVALTLEP